MGLAQAGMGDIEGGAARVETYMDMVSNAGGNFTFPQNQIVLSELQIDQGNIEQALDRLERVCQPGWARGELLNKPEYHRVRAKAFAALGDIDKAISEAETALQLAQNTGAIVLEDRARRLLETLSAETTIDKAANIS